MENMDIRDVKDELSKEISRLELEIHKSAKQTAMHMITVVVSIWAVTLITASTLYIVTH